MNVYCTWELIDLMCCAALWWDFVFEQVRVVDVDVHSIFLLLSCIHVRNYVSFISLPHLSPHSLSLLILGANHHHGLGKHVFVIFTSYRIILVPVSLNRPDFPLRQIFKEKEDRSSLLPLNRSQVFFLKFSASKLNYRTWSLPLP